MPIITNPDQSMSYVDEPPKQMEIPEVPATTAVEQQQQQPPSQVDTQDWSAWDTPEQELTPVQKGDWSSWDEDEDEGATGNDIAAGALSGVFNLTLPANVATHFDSWADTPTRIIVTDPETGEFRAPWNWKLKSAREMVGIDEAAWDKLTAQQRRNIISKYTDNQILKATGGEDDSKAYVFTQLAGMLFGDPMLYTPAKLLQSRKANTLAYSGYGAIDVGLYESAHEGGATVQGALLGGGLGAAGGYLAGSAKLRGHKDPKKRAGAAKKLAGIQERFNSYNSSDKRNTMDAWQKAKNDFGITSDEQFEQLLIDSGNISSRHVTKDRGKRGVFDKVYEPVGVRLNEMSRKLYHNLVEMSRKSMARNEEFLMRTDDFVKDLDKLSTRHKELFKELKAAGLSGDKKWFDQVFEKAKLVNPKLAKELDDYALAMREMYQMSAKVRTRKAGAKAATPLGKEQDIFFHRAVKEPEQLKNWIAENWGAKYLDRLQKAVLKYGGKNPSDETLGRIYRDFLLGFFDKDGVRRVPKGTKYRKIKAEDFKNHPELVDMFHDFRASTHTYIKDAVNDYYKKQFLGTKLVDEFGDEVNNDLWAKLAEDLKIKNSEDIEELKTIMNALFIDSVKSPNKALRVFKDITYSGLLGNPISAVTQIGDIFIASAKYGIINTIQGAVRTVLRRGLSPKEMGLMENLIEEFVSTGLSRKILNKTLTWGGFKAVDQFGKASNMNAALVKWTKAIKTSKGMTDLQARWGTAFGDDFPDLVEGLKNFDRLAAKKVKSGIAGMTKREYNQLEQVKAMAFAELADVQPTIMTEMPLKYLQNPNGRLFYMLRTFQMKYFNLLRQKFWYELDKGNVRPAIEAGASLLSAYILGGVATDQLKNAILGRDNYADDQFIDHTIRALSGPLMLDRYSAGKLMSSSDPIPKAIENLAPPVGFYSPQAHTAAKVSVALWNDDPIYAEDLNFNKWVNQFPVLGKLINNFFLDGAEEWNTKRWKEHT